uniref:Neurotransmitter-gated ion-channel transmembrane domain-containing protein n=1 Tax=Panagrolaimus superbus TaxID=310955 RepID=A0A914XXN0_9BILA
MPDMHLRKIESGWCNGTYATGVWSCQTAVFKVDRQMTQHIMQTYLPSGIIIVISWFNFWLDIDSAPARVSLSITVLLTISTQANGVKLALPEVSYLKAIDVWLGVCLAFAFGVMIEFTICHYAKNQEMRHTAPTSNLILDQTLSTLFGSSSNGEAGKGSSTYPFIDEDDAERQLQRENSVEARLRIPPELNAEAAIKFMMNGGDSINQARLKNKQRSLRVNAKQALSWTRNLCNIRGRAVAIKIDERSRIAFPLTFLLFNFVYWTFYLYSS